MATPSPENAITSASLVPTMIDSDMNTEDLDMETKYRQALQRADNAEKLVQNARAQMEELMAQYDAIVGENKQLAEQLRQALADIAELTAFKEADC